MWKYNGLWSITLFLGQKMIWGQNIASTLHGSETKVLTSFSDKMFYQANVFYGKIYYFSNTTCFLGQGIAYLCQNTTFCGQLWIILCTKVSMEKKKYGINLTWKTRLNQTKILFDTFAILVIVHFCFHLNVSSFHGHSRCSFPFASATQYFAR